MPAPLRFAVLICAALAACGDDAVQDNECQVSALRYGKTVLVSTAGPIVRDLPVRTGELELENLCARSERSAETRRGIPPSVAVFPPFPYERGNARVHMYVADDTLVPPRDHPLHRYVYGRPDRPDLTSGRRCRPVAFTAEVINVWPSGLLIDPGERELKVEARTVVDGPVLDGVPRIARDASVHIKAVRCKGRRAPVARRITVRR